MSLFHDEQLQFSTDWTVVREWFDRRARESGNYYGHSEDITHMLEGAIPKEIQEAAAELGRHAGESIADAFEAAITAEE